MSLQKSIERLDSLALVVDAPLSNVIHSMLGEMYWGYYQQNRWQFHQRTFSETATDDIATWDFKRIVEAADSHFRKSLETPEDLERTQLKDYESILSGRNEYRNLRPTLYHLLISRALEFYSSDERDLVNFDEDGYFNGQAFLATSDHFLKIDFEKGEGTGTSKVDHSFISGVDSGFVRGRG